MEISDTKKAFLESLEIDINNLPDEFNKFNNGYNGSVKSKEASYLFFEAPKFTSRFCMKDIVGTKHPDYENKSFFDSFLTTKRGDIIINSYINNPEYYEKVLKQPDQSYETCRHDTPIELYKVDDENYYVVGGNNRINLMMMLYLTDLSKAKTDKEKEEVYKKHTYYAVIKALPKNKKIVNVITLLKEIYKNIGFKFAGENPNDCIYDVNINGIIYHISNYEELYELFKNAYSLKNVKDEKGLSDILDKLFLNLNCSFYGDKVDFELINSLYPNLKELQELYRKAKVNNILNRLDYSNLTYGDLLNQLKRIVTEFLNEVNKEKINKAQNYFIDCENVTQFVSVMDDLIDRNNHNLFEIVFEDVIESYPSFKNMFLEVRNYLANNHSSDVIEFTYNNIYNYMVRIIVEKKMKECEEKEQKISSFENNLNNFKRKLSIENNGAEYLSVCSDIDTLNFEKDILESKKTDKEKETFSLYGDLTKLNHKIEEIKKENIFIRIFHLRKLKRLEQEYDLVNSKNIKNKEEFSNLEMEINNSLNKISEKKQSFSSKLELGMNFDNFKSEQERLKGYSISTDILGAEITKLNKEIAELYFDLENKKIELDEFCKKYDIDDITSFKK